MCSRPSLLPNLLATLVNPGKAIAPSVTVLTGMWSLMAIDITSTSSAYQATVLLKIAVAIAAGVFAAIHAAGKSTLSIAIGGAVGALASVAAVFLGILLHTGTA